MDISAKRAKFISILIIFCFIFALGAIGFTENKVDVPKEDRFTKGLESLIEKGVITAEELGKIKDYLKSERAEKKKIFEQMKDMNEEQRKEFIENYRKNKVDIIEKMVKDKVISKEQAEEIRKIMSGRKHHKKTNW